MNPTDFITFTISKLEFDLNTTEKPQKCFYVISYKDKKWTCLPDEEKKNNFKWMNVNATLSLNKEDFENSSLVIEIHGKGIV